MKTVCNGPRILTDEQVRNALDMRSLIGAMAHAFAAPAGGYNTPKRWNLAREGNGALIMPCQSSRFTAVKVSTWRRDPGRGPRVTAAHYSMFDLATGRQVLACDATGLTEMRTAAVSAMVTDKLAPTDAKVLGIFGTGPVAHEHLRAMRCVRPFERVLVCGSSMEKSAAFADASAAEGLDVRAVSADECASLSEVICTCTTSTVPLFDGTCLRVGTHINAVGAFNATDRELDSEAIRRSWLIVDRKEDALVEVGEITLPWREGRISEDHIAGDVAEMMRHDIDPSRQGHSISVFKSVGLAMEDMVAAELLLQSFLT